MKYSLFLLSFFLLLTSQILLSQTDSLTFESTNELIQKANEFHDQGDYASSIGLLEKISPADPDYTNGCYEMALSYNYAGNQEMALQKLGEARFLGYNEPTLDALESSIYDDMGNSSKGIEILDSALKKWPYNNNLLYNLGICYLNAGNYEKAEQIFLQNLRINPYHARTNLGLAHVNLAMGRIAQAYLAYNMGILLSPGISNLTDYENAIAGRLKIIPRPYLYPYPDGYDHAAWDELSALMKSEFAMKDDFVYPYKMNYTICRQNYMLLQNIRYNSKDTSIYNTFYGKFFSDMVQSGHLDVYMNFILKNAATDEINKWLNDHSADVETFVKHAQEVINAGREVCFSSDNEAKGIKYYHYDDDGDLESIGNITGDGSRNGEFIELDKKGSITNRGNYVNNELQGEWLIYWPNGQVKQRLNYKDGSLDGICYTYHPNGEKSGIYPMKAGVKNGKVEEYSSSGKLVSVNNYVNGITDGKVEFHDYSENFVREFTNVKDTTEGKFAETWINGVVKKEANYVKGNYDGPEIEKYPNGTTESEIIYKNGRRTGRYSTYFMNGQLSEAGEYDADGELTGIYTTYDRNGRTLSVIDHYEKGLMIGTLTDFYADGKVKMLRFYGHDTLTRMQCFDDRGNRLYDQAAEGSQINFKQFYENGILQKEGLRINGYWEGHVKEYNPLGLLTEDFNYKDGMLSGLQKRFFTDGTLKEAFVCDSNDVVGIYTTYFENGHVQSVGHYNKKGLNGELVYYYSNDSVQYRLYYLDNTPAGQQMSYAPDGKRTIIEFYNDNGDKTRSINYDSTGAVTMDFNYENGCHEFNMVYPNNLTWKKLKVCDNKEDGIQEVYYPNGQLQNKINLVSGMHIEKEIQYDHHGNVNSEVNYVMGKRQGKSILYEDGKINNESDFENGLYQGLVTSYYYNGKKQRVLEMSEGERNGFAWYYAPDGNLIYRLKYIKGQITAYSYMDKAGQMLDDIPVTIETREVIAYYPNGKISARIGIRNGVYDGNYKFFYNTGLPLKEINFENSLGQGIEKDYYANGKLREVVQYINDDHSGPVTRYYENGSIKMTGYYLADKQHGQWHFYDQTGKETETVQFYNDEIINVVKK